jgi:thiol-disulfide isomerase/thioredoxin
MQKYPVVIGVFVAVLCLCSGTAGAARLPEGLPSLLRTHNFNLYTVPCPANNMVLRDLKGRVVNLSALRGKVVILSFWKIDCAPCAAEKPILQRLHNKYAPRGLEIVAVNLFDDHSRVKSYARKGGYGFTFCYDADRRFSVQKQSLGGGVPTTFVVNGKSEAIYEVPGVPTSYLIDRKGQVVGNAVGMVNWEEQPFIELLESLLGPARPVVAQNTARFSGEAGQGPVANPSVRSVGPRRGNEPEVRQTVKEPTEKSASRGNSSDVPDQVLATRSNTPVSSAKARKPEPSSVSRNSHPTAPPKHRSRKPVAGERKRRATMALGSPVEYGKPKQFRPSTSHGSLAGTTDSRPRYLAQAATGTNVPTPYSPPRNPPAMGRSVPGGNLQPGLPAAMPYTPPNIPSAVNRTAARRPVTPDEDGQVMARIPERYSAPQEITTGAPEKSTPIARPFSQPRLPSNPIDGFILDSFKRNSAGLGSAPQALYPAPTPEPEPVAAPAPAPASSVFGQLGRDVRNLGQGIKQTFSSWWPGR